ALLPLRRLTKTIPIVFTAVSDPVSQGFVSSVSRPGGNLTGFSNFDADIGSKWLQLLKEIVPAVREANVMFNPRTSPYNAFFMNNLELERFEVRSPSEFEGAFLAMERKRVNAMTVIEDAMLIANSKAVVSLVTERRLPSIAFKEITDGGGLMAYGVNFAKLFHRAAYFVDKILKGANLSNLPVEQATKFDLVINLQAAKTLGLEIPPMLPARADKVIE